MTSFEQGIILDVILNQLFLDQMSALVDLKDWSVGHDRFDQAKIPGSSGEGKEAIVSQRL